MEKKWVKSALLASFFVFSELALVDIVHSNTEVTMCVNIYREWIAHILAEIPFTIGREYTTPLSQRYKR